MDDDLKRAIAPVKRKRRTHSKAFKAELVAMAKSGEQSVAQLALDHRLNANQLRKWIKESQSRSASGTMVPINVVESVIAPNTETPLLELAIHGISVRFYHRWDPVAVATLISSLR